MSIQRILVVEDELELAELLKDYLAVEGYAVEVIMNGDDVLAWLKKQPVALIVLDLMLPGKDGLTVFREVRELGNTPIIMATAKVEEIDRLLGIELGADDYVCKPYSMREMVARVKMVLRRTQRNESPEQQVDWLGINKAAYSVTIEGRNLGLTAVEFQLFLFLYQHPGRIFSREQIMRAIYSDGRVVSDRTVDSHIKKIRKKILAVSTARQVIHSIYGVGYKLELEL